MIITSHNELGELLFQIKQTKLLFEKRAKRLEIDQNSMKRMHHEYFLKYGDLPEHAGLCAVHKALFKVHRKITREHSSIFSFCNIIQNRLEEGDITADECNLEIARLREILAAIQTDFKLLEDQRLRILEEHKEFIESMKKKESKTK